MAGVLVSIFGKISYRPPHWITNIFSRIIICLLVLLMSWLRLLSETPKRFFLYHILLGCAGFGIFKSILWYQALPQPKIVSLTFSEIQVPSLSQPEASPQNLDLIFSDSSAALNLLGKDLSSGVSLSPSLGGKWSWVDHRTLRFQPISAWPIGQRFLIKIDRSMLASHIRLDKSEYEFYAPRLQLLSQSTEFYQDPVNPKVKQALLKLKFSHLVDKTDLERRTKVKFRIEPEKTFDKNIGFRLTFNDEAGEAFIRSESLSIFENSSEVQITVEKGLKAAAGGSGITEEIIGQVSVPSLENFFKILSVSERVITSKETHQAERIISIESSSSIQSTELIKNTEILLLPNDLALYQLNPILDQDQYSDGNPNICPWQEVSQVPAQAIAKARTLEAKWIDSEKNADTFSSFKVAAEAGRCILIKIKKGTSSFAGIPLANERAYIIQTQDLPKDIIFTDKGSILALSGERKINFLSRGLENIQFKLFRVLPNSLHHLSQMGFNYPQSYSEPNFDYNFGPDHISEVYQSTLELSKLAAEQTQYSFFDFGRYLDQFPANERGLFILRISGYDPVYNSSSGPQVDRLVLVSDLGFLVKDNADFSSHVFVMSTSKGSAAPNVKVEVLGKNGLAIVSTQTDENGKANLPNLKDFKNEKTPTTYVVSDGRDLSFMPYALNDRKLNFSKFEIGGLYNSEEAQSLQAFAFSDRGIYRPGEAANFGLILKKLDWSILPQNLPLEISIRDPREVELTREKINFPSDGFREYNFPIPESALTGPYSLSLQIIGTDKQATVLAETRIRVEEFQPDRLNLNVSWSKPSASGWIKPENLSVDVNLRNLYGSAAAEHKIKSQLKLRPNSITFKDFSGYNFFDPYASSKSSFDQSLGEIYTDSQGQAKISLELEKFEPASYSLTALIEGFEKNGGRSVATTLSTLISPNDYLLGWKADADLSFIKSDLNPTVKIIAVDPQLQQTQVNNVTLELNESKIVSVLTKTPSDSLEYQSITKTEKINSVQISIPTNGYDLPIKASKPGDYFYRLLSDKGQLLNTIKFTIVGNSDTSRILNKDSALDIRLNKSDYNADEEIEISIKSPYKGSGLITIERDKVYASSWFYSESNSSIQRIKIPPSLEGNAYVNVAMVRSLDSKEIFANPLSYATAPFSISKETRSDKINIDLPPQIKPGEMLNFSVSSQGPTKAIVFAVDQGILQVARYKRPQPLEHFFRKRALEVSTKQILDLLLPEFSISRESAGIGGDEDSLLGKHRNPFKRKSHKPVVFWSGPIEINAQAKELGFPIPDYFNGTIKFFAISVSDSKLGSVEKEAIIKSDLVLQPNLPLFASPGDEFTTSAVVANTTEQEQQVQLKLELTSGLEIIGQNSLSTKIAAGKDHLFEFRLKAAEDFGSSRVLFLAQSNSNIKSSYSLDISIRPATPRLTSLQFGSATKSSLSSGSKEIEIKRQLYSKQSEANLSWFSHPIGLGYALYKYLDYFPHGCTEQITSKAFPLLLLPDISLVKIDSLQQSEGIKSALQKLSNNQNESGAFYSWRRFGESKVWVNLHVIRFIIEAKAKGFNINPYLHSNIIRYIKNLASEPLVNTSLDSARLKAYAIYLLTREENTSANYLQTLSEEIKSISGWQKDILAVFMAASYSLQLMQDKSNQLLSQISSLNFEKSSLPIFSSFSSQGLVLDLLSRHFPSTITMRLFNNNYFEELLNLMNIEQIGTVEAANLILGISSFSKIQQSATTETPEIQVSRDSSNYTIIDSKHYSQSAIQIEPDLKKIRISPSGKQPLFYQFFQSGFDKPASQTQNSTELEIFKEFRGPDGKVSESFKLGDEIDVILRIRNKSQAEVINDLALIDLFPSGFELATTSEALRVSSSDHWSLEYADATEDRVLFYGQLWGQFTEIKYKVKAVAQGNFVVPPFQVEGMYNPTILSRTNSSRIQIN